VAVRTFYVYKRGLLVMRLSSTAGSLQPTLRSVATRAHAFCHGQFLSTEWEPRIRALLSRAVDFVDFVELLEDRRYHVTPDAPSTRYTPLRFTG
jgi:hypothetical protein